MLIKVVVDGIPLSAFGQLLALLDFCDCIRICTLVCKRHFLFWVAIYAVELNCVVFMSKVCLIVAVLPFILLWKRLNNGCSFSGLRNLRPPEFYFLFSFYYRCLSVFKYNFFFVKKARSRVKPGVRLIFQTLIFLCIYLLMYYILLLLQSINMFLSQEESLQI